MYLFKYGGVDQATGLPLFASTVSSSNIDKLQRHRMSMATSRRAM
ncbi:MAG: hypothetical protein ACLR8Y_05810 [Alistipes indistinctus]